MRWNNIRIALGGVGIVMLTVLAVTGTPTDKAGDRADSLIVSEDASDIVLDTALDFTPEFVKRRFETLDWIIKDETIVVEAAAVSEPAVITEPVSQPAAEPVIIQPEPQPNSQIMVAAAEPLEEVEETVEVPVITSVETPGESQVEQIEFDPVVVPVTTPTPDISQNQPTDSVAQPVFSQTEQMASIQSGATSIMGTSYTYLEQMIRYYNANKVYPVFYANTDAPTIEAFCKIYIEEAATEGVRAEVAFCQAMKETGFLTYTGDVRIEQFNFAGIGATGGGVQGNYFGSVRDGIKAQIQHLKAYASTDALNGTCVDPRFRYVKRGTTPYVEWLGIQENPYGGGWAAAKNYGPSIINDYIAKLFSY